MKLEITAGEKVQGSKEQRDALLQAMKALGLSGEGVITALLENEAEFFFGASFDIGFMSSKAAVRLAETVDEQHRNCGHCRGYKSEAVGEAFEWGLAEGERKGRVAAEQARNLSNDDRELLQKLNAADNGMMRIADMFANTDDAKRPAVKAGLIDIVNFNGGQFLKITDAGRRVLG